MDEKPQKTLQRAMELLPETFSSRLDRLHFEDGGFSNGSRVDEYRPFSRILDAVAADCDRSHWVVKGTSFIFYAPEVLAQIPSLKMIYLIRNPLDLVASNYKRVQRTIEAGDDLLYGDWLFTPLLSWKQGINLAMSVKEDFPDRVHLVRYEDMVREDDVVETLFDFVGVPFDPSYLKVSHVNQSDHPTPGAHQKTVRKGLNASRVGYYTEVLSADQVYASYLMLPGDEVQRWYPDLSGLEVRPRDRWKAQKHYLTCGARLVRRLWRGLADSPQYTLRRIWRRVAG